MWLPINRSNQRTRIGRLLINMVSSMLLIGMVASTFAAAGSLYEHMLTRAQWPAHANGQNIIALPAVAQALRRFVENDKTTIVIQYPGGDPGRMWADELYNWLISFGIPIRYLELQPGSGAVDRLVVSVISRG